MNKIRFCQFCESYTLKELCGRCGEQTVINAPQKYSRDETVAYYRRQIKRTLIDKMISA